MLRDHMARKKITMADIAEELHLTGSAVSQKFSGKTRWYMDEMYIVMDYLELPYDQLYIYFPRYGEEVETVERKGVREYLRETQQTTIPIASLQALAGLVNGICEPRNWEAQ